MEKKEEMEVDTGAHDPKMSNELHPEIVATTATTTSDGEKNASVAPLVEQTKEEKKKKCLRCTSVLPTDRFQPCPGTWDGLRRICVDCVFNSKRSAAEVETPMNLRLCKKCENSFPLSYFDKGWDGSGYQPWCKPCIKNYTESRREEPVTAENEWQEEEEEDDFKEDNEYARFFRLKLSLESVHERLSELDHAGLKSQNNTPWLGAFLLQIRETLHSMKQLPRIGLVGGKGAKSAVLNYFLQSTTNSIKSLFSDDYNIPLEIASAGGGAKNKNMGHDKVSYQVNFISLSDWEMGVARHRKYVERTHQLESINVHTNNDAAVEAMQRRCASHHELMRAFYPDCVSFPQMDDPAVGAQSLLPPSVREKMKRGTEKGKFTRDNALEMKQKLETYAKTLSPVVESIALRGNFERFWSYSFLDVPPVAAPANVIHESCVGFNRCDGLLLCVNYADAITAGGISNLLKSNESALQRLGASKVFLVVIVKDGEASIAGQEKEEEKKLFFELFQNAVKGNGLLLEEKVVTLGDVYYFFDVEEGKYHDDSARLGDALQRFGKERLGVDEFEGKIEKLRAFLELRLLLRKKCNAGSPQSEESEALTRRVLSLLSELKSKNSLPFTWDDDISLRLEENLENCVRLERLCPSVEDSLRKNVTLQLVWDSMGDYGINSIWRMELKRFVDLEKLARVVGDSSERQLRENVLSSVRSMLEKKNSVGEEQSEANDPALLDDWAQYIVAVMFAAKPDAVSLNTSLLEQMAKALFDSFSEDFSLAFAGVKNEKDLPAKLCEWFKEEHVPMLDLIKAFLQKTKNPTLDRMKHNFQTWSIIGACNSDAGKVRRVGKKVGKIWDFHMPFVGESEHVEEEVEEKEEDKALIADLMREVNKVLDSKVDFSAFAREQNEREKKHGFVYYATKEKSGGAVRIGFVDAGSLKERTAELMENGGWMFGRQSMQRVDYPLLTTKMLHKCLELHQLSSEYDEEEGACFNKERVTQDVFFEALAVVNNMAVCLYRTQFPHRCYGKQKTHQSEEEAEEKRKNKENVARDNGPPHPRVVVVETREEKKKKDLLLKEKEREQAARRNDERKPVQSVGDSWMIEIKPDSSGDAQKKRLRRGKREEEEDGAAWFDEDNREVLRTIFRTNMIGNKRALSEEFFAFVLQVSEPTPGFDFRITAPKSAFLLAEPLLLENDPAECCRMCKELTLLPYWLESAPDVFCTTFSHTYCLRCAVFVYFAVKNHRCFERDCQEAKEAPRAMLVKYSNDLQAIREKKKAMQAV